MTRVDHFPHFDLFEEIRQPSLAALPAILDRLGIPHRRAGNEIQMLAVHRGDKRFGSFTINSRSGKWADFASGDRGGDVASLIAYLQGTSQFDAATNLAHLLGVKIDAR